MDFIYDFERELVEEIIRHAVKQGYSILITEWIDEWEREEGCPSGRRKTRCKAFGQRRRLWQNG